MPIDEDLTLRQLQVITKILTIAHADRVEKELDKFVRTDDRRRMWILIDGARMAKDIAGVLKITERGVNYFLKDLGEAGLIENPRGKPPRKLLEFVPVSWLQLMASLPAEVDSSLPSSSAQNDQTSLDKGVVEDGGRQDRPGA